MSKIKCGILFNGKQNLFKKYLKWIIKEQDKKKFKISYVHTNNPDLIKNLNISLGSYEEVLDNSDVVFSLGYWKKIDKQDIDRIRLGIVNFHHSYELKFRGRHCSTWAIMHKEKFHGSTIHFIDEKIDEGKIIDTDYFKILDSDVAETIFKKSNEVGYSLLKKNFYKIINQRTMEYKPAIMKNYTYKAKDLVHEIQLTDDKESLLRQIRSLTFDKMPAPYLLLNNRKVYLKLDDYDSGKCNKRII